MPTTVIKAIRSDTAWAADQTAMEALYGVGGYYTSLGAWEAALPSNITSAGDDTIRVAECYDDFAAGLGRVTFSGVTTNGTNYIVVRVAPGHGHEGDPTAGAFIELTGTNQSAIRIQGGFVYLYDLRLEGGNYTGGVGVYVYASDSQNVAAIPYRLIIKNFGYIGVRAYRPATSSASVYIQNSLFLDCVQATGQGSYGSVSAYNCTAANGTNGFVTDGAASSTYQNCVAYNFTNPWSGTSFNVASKNNATSKPTDDAPGGASVVGVTSAAFVNAAGGDFHLSETSVLRGAGAYLGASWIDIDGDEWPSSGAWDIGFDYYVASGGSATGTGSLAALALASPTASASGSAAATGAPAQISLAAPTGSASGSTVVNGNATGLFDDVALAAPTASATGGAAASTSPDALSLVAPTGSAVGSAVASASLNAVSLVAPTTTATGSATASGSLAAIVLAAPTGSATGTEAGNALATGSIATLSLSAPTGSASGSATALGSFDTLSLTPPTGSASAFTGATATGSLPSLALVAPTGSATGSAAASGTISGIALAAPSGSAAAYIPGTGTLTPETIAAIAGAVWAHSSAVQIEARLAEAWGRLGLDPANPLISGQTEISFGSIVMALTGNESSSTLTRQ